MKSIVMLSYLVSILVCLVPPVLQTIKICAPCANFSSKPPNSFGCGGQTSRAGFSTAVPNQYFKIRVVDGQTGRGVPLVELTTVNSVRYVTDSNGVVAFFEPGLMGRNLFFFVRSHGYEFPKDRFGFRGRALKTTPGDHATLQIRRINVAERLYRITGAGLYRDSLLVGDHGNVPISQPLLNGQVLGSDSVINAVYHGRLFWFWGDTNRPRHPLGNFHVPGATSLLPKDGGLSPDKGVDLIYFLDPTGFAQQTAQMPGKGPTWINGLVVVPDADSHNRLVAHYVKVKAPLTVYQQGLCAFDDEQHKFQKLIELPKDTPFYPHGHPFLLERDHTNYVYFADPYPLLRVPATFEQLQNLNSYEAFTCLKPGSRMDDPHCDRDSRGTLRYSWQHDTPVVGPFEQQKLVKKRLIQAHEALLQLQDVDTGQPILAHRGSVYWNDYRKRWVMIAVQSFGSSSMLGEIWYAEADTPTGPWVYAAKIVTHAKYSFYNPKQHPYFNKQNGRFIYFEGTYTNTFSGNPDRTPWYNYNQIMYRLNLDDPRVQLPVAVYGDSKDSVPDHFTLSSGGREETTQKKPVAFFALDRPKPNTIGLTLARTPAGQMRLAPLSRNADDWERPLFYTLPAKSEKPPKTTVLLYEFQNDRTHRYAYSVDPEWKAPGFHRAADALGLVWRNPRKARSAR